MIIPISYKIVMTTDLQSYIFHPLRYLLISIFIIYAFDFVCKHVNARVAII